MNLRRAPGVIYQHKAKVGCITAGLILTVYVALQTGIVCTNSEIEVAVKELCQEYSEKKIGGFLCPALCTDNVVHSFSCIPNHAGKRLVFTANYDDTLLVFKSAYMNGETSNVTDEDVISNENLLRIYAKDVLTNKLNITVTDLQLNKLLTLEGSKKSRKTLRPTEIQDLRILLQSQEYLLSSLFAEQEVFPKIHGTCGHLYAVEYLKMPEIASPYFSDSGANWWLRLNIAVNIMDLLEELETKFQDPIRLCDIKMAHFGLTTLGRLKVTDLDDVYTDNVLQRILSQGQQCTKDADCDLFDCKSSCNSHTKRCDNGLVNSNLQVICEKIFIGWTMNGKMIIPGLLMTEDTPPALAALLRQCAENGRSPVPEDIRQRLYTTLTEMEQVMSERYQK